MLLQACKSWCITAAALNDSPELDEALNTLANELHSLASRLNQCATAEITFMLAFSKLSGKVQLLIGANE